MSALHQNSGVMGLGQSVFNLHPQELGAADSLHCCVVDERWCVTGLALPEVKDDLFGFLDIQIQVVGFAPPDVSPSLCRSVSSRLTTCSWAF